MSRGTDNLFSRTDAHSLFEYQNRALADEIRAYDADGLLNTSTEDLVAYFYEKYSLDPPILRTDNISVDHREVQMDVSRDQNRMISDRSRPFYVTALEVEVQVPFTGDAELFRVQPTRSTTMPPRAEIFGQCLKLWITGTNLSEEGVRREVERTLKSIDEYLEWLHNDARSFNEGLKENLRRQLELRKAKALGNKNLVAGLGFALVERGQSKTFVAPAIQRKIPQPPSPTSSPYKPEPVLERKEYEHILGLMENMAHVMELSPKAFAQLGEEELRTHFLVQLNGQYEGQATGETFNFDGKTDIIIKVEGRNIFIAECKFWTGEKGYLATLDQLLGYLSWRDSKAAVVIFNRNEGFSAVLQKIQEATPKHANCKKLIAQRSETSWEYLFYHPQDRNREMFVTVSTFNVPRPGTAQ